MGALVGEDVGDSVGVLVGEDVGEAVGVLVGEDVGDAVFGAFVGLGVVGGQVPEFMQISKPLLPASFPVDTVVPEAGVHARMKWTVYKKLLSALSFTIVQQAS